MSRWQQVAVLTKSDDESDGEPLIRSTGQTRNEEDVNTQVLLIRGCRGLKETKMLNEYAEDNPTLPVNHCFSHFIQILAEC